MTVNDSENPVGISREMGAHVRRAMLGSGEERVKVWCLVSGSDES